MSPWRWHVGHYDSVEDDGVYDIDECGTRDEAIQSGLRETAAGARFYVIEARSSEAAQHKFSDIVPLLRTRNKELLTHGPRDTAVSA